MSRKLGLARATGLATLAVAAAPAQAHPGPHHTMSFAELAAHLATGWHLAMLLGAGALATVVGLLAANRGRRARARRAAPSRRSAS